MSATESSASTAASASRPAPRSKPGVHLALFAVGFGAFLSLYATQPLLPMLRQTFAATEFQASLTVSAPVLAVALMAPLAGLLADAIGRKRVIIASLLGMTLPTALLATAADLNQIIFWRFLQGLFVPAVIASAIAYISEESPPGTVGATMATYVSGTVVGGFAGRFTLGLVAQHWGWRAGFVVIAAMLLAMFAIAARLLPKPRNFVPQSSAREALRSMRAHLSNPKLLATFAVGFNVLFTLVGTFTYVNFYLADEPFLLGTAALASIFFVYLIGAVITPLAGRVLDRIGFRRMLMLCVAFSSCGLLLTLAKSLPLVVLGLTLQCTGVFAGQSASSGHIGHSASKARSSAAGLYVTFYYLGGFAGSALPGLLWASYGWLGCVVLMLCMQAISIAIAWKFWAN